jgi:hypothetical protein
MILKILPLCVIAVITQTSAPVALKVPGVINELKGELKRELWLSEYQASQIEAALVDAWHSIQVLKHSSTDRDACRTAIINELASLKERIADILDDAQKAELAELMEGVGRRFEDDFSEDWFVPGLRSRHQGTRHDISAGVAYYPGQNFSGSGQYLSIKSVFDVTDNIKSSIYARAGRLKLTRSRSLPELIYRCKAGATIKWPRAIIQTSVRFMGDNDLLNKNAYVFASQGLFRFYRTGRNRWYAGYVYSSSPELWRYPYPLPSLAYGYVSVKYFVLIGSPTVLLAKPSKLFLFMMYFKLPGAGHAELQIYPSGRIVISFEFERVRDMFFFSGKPGNKTIYLRSEINDLLHKIHRHYVYDGNTAGAGFTARYLGFCVKLFGGYRYASSVYYTKNILGHIGPKRHMGNGWFFKASFTAGFSAGKDDSIAKEFMGGWK